MAINDISSTSQTVEIATYRGIVDPDRPESLYQDRIFDYTPPRRESRDFDEQSVRASLLMYIWLFLKALVSFIPNLANRFFVWIRIKLAYLWRRLNQPGFVPYAESGQAMTLVDLIAHTPDKRTLGTQSSVNIWEVPFQNFVLLSGEGGPCDTTLLQSNVETEVSDAIKRELRGSLEPGKPVRVRCMPCPALDAASEHEVRVFMGRSIFAPDRDATQIGWVRFVLQGTDENDSPVPKFPDGDNAAIYAGQKAIGFAICDPTLPANLSLPLVVQKPSGVWFSIHGVSSIDSKQDSETEHVQYERRTTKGTGEVNVVGKLKMSPSNNRLVDACMPLIITAQNAKPGSTQQTISGVLEICLDFRISRLRYERASTADFAFSAIEIKQDDLPVGSKGIWINLDARKNLIFSSLQAPRYTVCYRFEEHSVSYVDWHQPRLTLTPFGSGVIVDKTENGIRFSRANGQPFGFLAPSDEAQTVTFTSGTNSKEHYALDWLNASGCVMKEGELVGLAEAYSNAKDFPNPLRNHAQGNGETIRLGPLVLERVKHG